MHRRGKHGCRRHLGDGDLALAQQPAGMLQADLQMMRVDGRPEMMREQPLELAQRTGCHGAEDKTVDADRETTNQIGLAAFMRKHGLDLDVIANRWAMRTQRVPKCHCRNHLQPVHGGSD